MTTSNMLLAPYNDFDDATLSVNVTLPTGFEAVNLQNPYRDDVLLTSDTTTMVITGVWPESRTINGQWLFRHRLHGANWRVQYFSDTGASAAVSGADTGTIATLSYTANEPYTWSTGTKDPLQFEAPSWAYFASDYTARSFKITISGTPSIGAYFEIGRVFIGRSLTLPANVAYGATLGMGDLSRSNRTEGGTRTSRTGEKFRTFKGDLNDLSTADLGTWMQIHGKTGTTRDIATAMFPGDGTSLERHTTMNCYLSSLDALGFQVNRFTKTLQFEEA